MSDAIHDWFGLTYANYLVLPRSVLQSMPEEWQDKLVELLEQAGEMTRDMPWPEYRVQAVQRGRFIKDPIPSYDRGRTRVELRPSPSPNATEGHDPFNS